MKLPCAIALALVGWYLMVPPLDTDSSVSRRKDELPLSEWVIVGSFDTADACRQKREADMRRAHAEASKIPLKERDSFLTVEGPFQTLCIATEIRV